MQPQRLDAHTAPLKNNNKVGKDVSRNVFLSKRNLFKKVANFLSIN